MRIASSINYYSDDVATFDPEKVIERLRAAFPEAEVDPTDRSAEDVERVRQFVESQADADSELREQQGALLAQARFKARHNGPVYSFRLADIYGTASRYHVPFHCQTEIHPSVRKRIVAFLKSLKLGRVTVRSGNTEVVHWSGRRRWKFW